VSDTPLPAQIALSARGGEHDNRFTRTWARLREDPRSSTRQPPRREAADDAIRYEATEGTFFTRLERMEQ
jgi:hypothetical protein